MNKDLSVVLMALGMFLVTFFFGYAPTKLNTSQRVMNLIAIYGAGLLVGAALVVIVPEGMMVLYTSLLQKDKIADRQIEQALGTVENKPLSFHTVQEGSPVDENVTSYVGASLILGFTAMLILD